MITDRKYDAELRDALAIDDFTARRKALRAIAAKRLAFIHQARIEEAYNKSFLVGTLTDQINPRCTHSGLRDALCEDVLIGLAYGGVTADHVLQAISFPSNARPNSASKTGYDFGCPDWLPHGDNAIGKLFTKENNTVKEIDNMGSDTQSLAIVRQAIAQAVFSGLADTTSEAADALLDIGVNKDIVDGAHALLQLNSEAENDDLNEHLASLRANGNYADEEVDDLANRIVKDVYGIGEPLVEASKPDDEPDDEVVFEAPANTKVLDLMLSEAGLPNIKKLLEEITSRTQEIAALKSAPAIPAYVGDNARGEIPSGKVVLRKASEVFGLKNDVSDAFSFDVPVWEWSGVHPDVPQIDENYIFRGSSLLRILYALLANKRSYLWGDSGTGKTSLVEQVAARLNTPFLRMNFDSDVSRMDLVGRDTLSKDGETTVSKFVDGILPQMLSGPNFCCFDEVDFCRPDVAYVMQRLLEGDGLVITEDGGRVVKPHPMCRIFATGNTQGQGDDRGMYAGARVQSAAMLDRFGCWVHVEYLDSAERLDLMKKRVPNIEANDLDRVAQYVSEHIEAFKDAKVMQPITPRGYVDLCEASVMFRSVFPPANSHLAFIEAINMVVLDRATSQDRAVLQGIVQRIC